MWMEKGDPAAIRDFLHRHDGSYVAEKLRADWIRWLGKRARVERGRCRISRAARPRARCHLLQPAGRLARDDRSVLNEADKLWLTMLEPPEAVPACARCAGRQPGQDGRRCLGARPPPGRKSTVPARPEPR